MNRYFIILTFLIFTVTGELLAQPMTVYTARERAMGNTSVAVISQNSVNNNQGAMVFSSSGAVLNVENRYFLSSLSTESLSGIYRKKRSAFGAQVSYSGDALYHETTGGIAYALQLSKWIGAGIKMNVVNIGVGNGYGSATIFSFDIGLFATLTDEITFGAHLSNPTRLSFTETQQSTLYYQLGMSYTALQEKALVTLELSNYSDSQPSLNAGIEYYVIKMLALRFGYASQQQCFGFGAGVLFNNFRVDVAIQYSNNLGSSPSIALCYIF